MKLDGLPSPGLLAGGLRLQTESIRAISYVEVMAALKGGTTEQAKTLDTFWTACKAAVAAFIDSVVPTYASGLITAATPKQLVLTYSEPLDPTVVPAASSFVSVPAKTFSSVVIQGSTVILTASAAYAAGAVTVTYTQPGTNGLRDLSGNLAATHTASAVTNQVV